MKMAVDKVFTEIGQKYYIISSLIRTKYSNSIVFSVQRTLSHNYKPSKL